MPSLLILIPLFAVIALNLPFNRIIKKAAFPFAVCLFIIQIMLAVSHHPKFWGGDIDALDTFFHVNFAVDGLSFIALLCIGIVSLASLVAARYTITNDERFFDFINLLVIESIGMCGIVMVRDIFSMYVFIEIAAVASFILIAIERDHNALEGSFKYIMQSILASVLMLAGVGLLMLVSGDVSFTAVRFAALSPSGGKIAVLAAAIFMSGLFIKGGLVPFHGWLPDAYTSAPSPVAILLAGIVTKISGIYALWRIFSLISSPGSRIGAVVLAMGAVSIVVGAFAALGQKDFKRMLAYSSISQTGYILLGLGLFTPLGIMGAAFHFFNHAVFKSLLFVNSAAVEKEASTRDIDKLGGLSAVMPVTGATSVVGVLSASGIPPLGGFWSKLLIVVALWDAGHYAYASLAVSASVLTLGYLLVMQRKVFFGKIREGLEGVKETNIGFNVISIVLAAITIGVGVFFPLLFNNFLMPLAAMIH